ncbi:unnamed protein product, partial [Ilex paraguariensis]
QGSEIKKLKDRREKRWKVSRKLPPSKCSSRLKFQDKQLNKEDFQKITTIWTVAASIRI